MTFLHWLMAMCEWCLFQWQQCWQWHFMIVTMMTMMSVTIAKMMITTSSQGRCSQSSSFTNSALRFFLKFTTRRIVRILRFFFKFKTQRISGIAKFSRIAGIARDCEDWVMFFSSSNSHLSGHVEPVSFQCFLNKRVWEDTNLNHFQSDGMENVFFTAPSSKLFWQSNY